ncbi:MAG: DUF2142 domain-containing protein [Atopobiaceae bacterium]|nr:DUF2142 domain-containing protein [Atopobiaceae bacterium]MCI1227338.1 DUF2142 domain-containing protein [Atopobiaceae bacterium]MCI1259837.1 DUF2142 domain-containing protein [Atopobiaceae bacterium]MDD2588021.1 DUF2142 domain-containing protein [Atopobiaceae bacterium]MDD3486046.1 DUF2142 domain-containing protein [Atopobiaceae bacterium]
MTKQPILAKPTHLRGDDRAAALDTKGVISLLLASVAAALLLEAGTVCGTPGASVLPLTAWSKTRLVIFFVLALAFFVISQRRDWAKRLTCATRQKASWVRDHAKPIAVCTAISLVGAIAVGTVITVLTGFSEPELLLPFLFILFANIAVIIEMLHEHSHAYAAFFLFCLLSVGIWFCVASPMKFVYSYDDEIHYSRAESLSYLTAPTITEADTSLDAPEYRDLSKPVIFSVTEQQETREQLDCENEQPPFQTLSSFTTVYNSSILAVSTLGAIPSAFGLWIGRLLHLSFSFVFILGKLCNLLFYGITIYSGMKHLASKQCLVGTIALTPMALFLACNYSYDPWITALSIYAFCRFISELQHPECPLTRGATFAMVATLVLALLPKAIYFPMVLLLLLMPKAKFVTARARRNYRLIVCGASLLLAVSFLLPMLIGGAGSGDSRGGSSVDSTGQIAFIMGNIPGYLSILTNFALSYIAPGCVTESLDSLAYVGTASALDRCLEVILLASMLFDVDATDIKYLGRATIRVSVVGLAALTVGLVCTALYISFTPVGSNTFAGVQGRYLIPLLFPLLALLPNLRIPHPNQSTLAVLTACANVFILFGALAIVFLPKFVA